MRRLECEAGGGMNIKGEKKSCDTDLEERPVQRTRPIADWHQLPRSGLVQRILSEAEETTCRGARREEREKTSQLILPILKHYLFSYKLTT